MARLDVPRSAPSDPVAESPLAALSRSLQSLEERLARIPARSQAAPLAMTEAPAGGAALPRQRSRAELLAEAVSEIAMRRKLLDGVDGEAVPEKRAIADLRSAAPRAAASPDGGSLVRRMQALAAEAQNLDGDDANLRVMTQIAGELQKLRTDMRDGLSPDAFETSFDDLRRSIDRLRETIAGRGDAKAIDGELDALSAGLARLTEAGADRAVLNSLRSELEDLHHMVRAGSAPPPARAAEDARVSRAGDDGAARAELKQELERLGRGLRSLAREDQNESAGEKGVSTAVREELVALRAKLEALFDESPMKAMEARWAELERRLDQRSVEASVERLAERMGEIEQRLVVLPEPVDVSVLEERIRIVAEGVEALAKRNEQADIQNFLSLEERLDEISRAIVASAAAPAIDMAPVERIEARIATLSTRLDGINETGAVERLASRVQELSARVEELSADPAGAITAQRMQSLAERIETAFAEFESQPASDTDALEKRLDAVAERFELAIADLRAQMPDAEAVTARLSGIAAKLDASGSGAKLDDDVVRSLEIQIASLSDNMTRVGSDHRAFEQEIEARLAGIEQRLEEHRDALIQAARNVAEETARRMQAVGEERQAQHVAQLSENLKALEALARSNDGQSGTVFDAVHATLAMIVDRLERMEAEIVSGGRVPTAQPQPMADRFDSFERFAPVPSAPSEPDLAGRARSAVAVDRVREDPVAVAPAPAPAVETAELIDRSEMNRPLEPGSGLPDIGALLERVRAAQRSRTETMPEPVEEAETRATARKAAKAASAEAEALRTSLPAKEPGVLKSLVARRRKAIVTGVVAVIVALSALPIGKAIMGARSAAVSEPAAVAAQPEPPAPVAEPGVDTASSLAPSVPPVPEAPAAAVDQAPAPAAPVPESEPALAAAPEAPPAPETPPASVPVSAETGETGALAAALGKLPASAALRPAVPDNIGPAPLTAAASAGDPKAAFEIGLRLLEGRTGGPQPTAALNWFADAARKGYVPAQYSVGTLFEKGNGIARDTQAARDWYTLAADGGNVRAMHNLAVLYATGIEGRAQPETAARWFTQAAEHGMRDSQYNLGILYARGSGVRQNLAEAYKWFGLVAEAGDSDAAAKRDEIGRSLSADELASAQGAVRAFSPAPRVEAANTVDTPAEWQDAKDQTSSVDMTKAIRNIQAILGRLGYDAGTPDGKLGDKTRTAIAAYRKDNALPESNEIDGPLIRSLLQKKDAKTGA